MTAEPPISLPDAESYDTRWQYRIVNLGAAFVARRLGMTLSYFGQRGWELVGVYDKASNWLNGIEKGFMLFKKAVPPGDEPDGPWTELWNTLQVSEAYQASQPPS